MTDLESAIDDAVEQAKATYDDAEKYPVDHGFAFVKGLDGRTSLAHELAEHDAIDVQSDGYHGTTVHIDGLQRYYTAQRGGYDAFIKTLQSHGVDGASDLSVWARRD